MVLTYICLAKQMGTWLKMIELSMSITPARSREPLPGLAGMGNSSGGRLRDETASDGTPKDAAGNGERNPEQRRKRREGKIGDCGIRVRDRQRRAIRQIHSQNVRPQMRPIRARLARIEVRQRAPDLANSFIFYYCEAGLRSFWVANAGRRLFSDGNGSYVETSVVMLAAVQRAATRMLLHF